MAYRARSGSRSRTRRASYRSAAPRRSSGRRSYGARRTSSRTGLVRRGSNTMRIVIEQAPASQVARPLIGVQNTQKIPRETF